MKEEFTQLLRLRFDERNRRMIKRFTEEKQRLNARGLLISSETVKAMHQVLETELKESTGTVVATAIDVISKKNLLLAKEKFQNFCSEALLKRKDEIEALYLSEVRHIQLGLQNKAMFQSHMSLGDLYPLQQEEMHVSLTCAYEKYLRDRGGNLASVINNGFLNRPVIAGAKIVMVVILLIAAFIGAIRGLQSLFG